MYGEPKDVPGECNARLCIADNFGDNHATMRCQREPAHEGKHREVFKSKVSGEVVVEWEHDDKLAHGEFVDVKDLEPEDEIG
jgi:hypothetical protein